MRNFFILLKKDITALIRTKKLLVMLVMLVLFAMESPIIAVLTPKILKSMGEEYAAITSAIPDPTAIDAFAQFNKNITQIVLLVTIAIFSSILVREKVKGTYSILKMNGVRLKEYLLSHICSQVIIFTASYLVSVMFFITYTIILFEKMPQNSLFSLMCLYLFMLVFIVLINVVSHFSNSTTMSMVISFSCYFVFLFLAIFEKLNQYLPIKLTEYATSILDGQLGLKHWETVLANIGIIVLLLCIGLFFKKDRINNRSNSVL
jgi:ABC-2 type transport system permease protein